MFSFAQSAGPSPDSSRTRLFVDDALQEGANIPLTAAQAHYLYDVLRMKEGSSVNLFNGHDGEWKAVIVSPVKKGSFCSVREKIAEQKTCPDIWLLAAPLKNSRTEWVIEKATELGISRFCPVATRYAVVDRINEERLRTLAIEAAEQCGRMDIPIINPLITLEQMFGKWPPGRHIIYGDETGASKNAVELLSDIPQGPLAVLLGPEGGFFKSEIEVLRNTPYALGMCMGPRILRADTAVVSALTLVMAASGAWEEKPSSSHA